MKDYGRFSLGVGLFIGVLLAFGQPVDSFVFSCYVDSSETGNCTYVTDFCIRQEFASGNVIYGCDTNQACSSVGSVSYPAVTVICCDTDDCNVEEEESEASSYKIRARANGAMSLIHYRSIYSLFIVFNILNKAS